MTTRVVNRLNDARHSRFVGREGELSLFASALTAFELPFQVLHVYGPGGVGKTTLLREFARQCAENEVRSFRLDGRNIEPAPELFLNALRNALSITSNESPLDALAANAQRQILLIDTYESLAPLDAWLHEFFFAQLPENVLIVLAGRNPPSPAARSDIGWQTLIRTVSLRNLNPDESRAFLTNQQVPPDQHPVVL